MLAAVGASGEVGCQIADRGLLCGNARLTDRGALIDGGKECAAEVARATRERQRDRVREPPLPDDGQMVTKPGRFSFSVPNP